MEEGLTVVIMVTVMLVVEIESLIPTGAMATADLLKKAAMKYVLCPKGAIVIIFNL